MRLEDLMERAAQYDENLARDIKDYVHGRKYGLVYEASKPEFVRMWKKPVVRGDIVNILPPRGVMEDTKNEDDPSEIVYKVIKTEADKKAALAEEQERAENMPRFFLRFQCASGFCGSLKFAVMNVSNNIAYTVDVYDIKIKGGSKTIWESDDTYGAPAINPQKEMTIQSKSPATNETGEFTLFATMSCMDKYDGKHEYILKMTCRYPNHYDDTSVTEIK